MVQVSVKDCSYVKLEEKKNLVFTKEKKKSLSQITENCCYKCAAGSGFGVFPSEVNKLYDNPQNTRRGYALQLSHI